MLHKLFLVEGLKMTREGLSDHRVNHWLGCPWARVQFKALIGLLVCGLKLKLLRLIVGHSICYILSMRGYLSCDTVDPAPGWPKVSTSF